MYGTAHALESDVLIVVCC